MCIRDRRWVADQVAAYKRLGGVTFVEKVPRSAAGKVLRRELSKVYAASKTS
jgi:acyl-coenzyme A synthetase/AMP-(fatty) acid ligase